MNVVNVRVALDSHFGGSAEQSSIRAVRLGKYIGTEDIISIIIRFYFILEVYDEKRLYTAIDADSVNCVRIRRRYANRRIREEEGVRHCGDAL